MLTLLFVIVVQVALFAAFYTMIASGCYTPRPAETVDEALHQLNSIYQCVFFHRIDPMSATGLMAESSITLVLGLLGKIIFKYDFVLAMFSFYMCFTDLLVVRKKLQWRARIASLRKVSWDSIFTVGNRGSEINAWIQVNKNLGNLCFMAGPMKLFFWVYAFVYCTSAVVSPFFRLIMVTFIMIFVGAYAGIFDVFFSPFLYSFALLLDGNFSGLAFYWMGSELFAPEAYEAEGKGLVSPCSVCRVLVKDSEGWGGKCQRCFMNTVPFRGGEFVSGGFVNVPPPNSYSPIPPAEEEVKIEKKSAPRPALVALSQAPQKEANLPQEGEGSGSAESIGVGPVVPPHPAKIIRKDSPAAKFMKDVDENPGSPKDEEVADIFTRFNRLPTEMSPSQRARFALEVLCRENDSKNTSGMCQREKGNKGQFYNASSRDPRQHYIQSQQARNEPRDAGDADVQSNKRQRKQRQFDQIAQDMDDVPGGVDWVEPDDSSAYDAFGQGFTPADWASNTDINVPTRRWMEAVLNQLKVREAAAEAKYASRAQLADEITQLKVVIRSIIEGLADHNVRGKPEASLAPGHDQRSHRNYSSYAIYYNKAKVCQVFFVAGRLCLPTHAYQKLAGKEVTVGPQKNNFSFVLKPEMVIHTNGDLTVLSYLAPKGFSSIKLKQLNDQPLKVGEEVLLYTYKGGNTQSSTGSILGIVSRDGATEVQTGPCKNGYFSEPGDCGSIVSKAEKAVGFHTGACPGSSNNFQAFEERDRVFFLGLAEPVKAQN